MEKIKQNFKKKNFFKINIKSWFKISVIVVIIVAVGGLVYLGYFLYQNVYLTIVQAEEIKVLKEKVAQEILDSKTFEDVLETLAKEKTDEQSSFKDIADPFKELE